VKAREIVQRYRKDPRVIVAVPLLILATTSLIYYAIQRAKELSTEALSSQVLLFVLWNINLLLILGIVFVLLRGIAKLVLERQRGIIGSRFRTKLVVTYMLMSLVPVGVLFFVATDLLRVSIDRWFNTPVRTILQNGETIAQMAQDQSAAVAASAAREIASIPSATDPSQLDGVLRGCLPRLAARPDDLGDSIHAVAHAWAPIGLASLAAARQVSVTRASRAERRRLRAPAML